MKTIPDPTPDAIRHGLVEILHRRIWNAWNFDFCSLPSEEYKIVLDALDESYQDIRHCKPGVRLDNAEAAFVVIIGVRAWSGTTNNNEAKASAHIADKIKRCGTVFCLRQESIQRLGSLGARFLSGTNSG